MKMAISILTVTQMLSPMFSAPNNHALLQEPTKPRSSASAARCETIGTNELTITCAYTAGSSVDADSSTAPRIILNRAAISFIPSDESHMRVELTFTNDSARKIAEHRAVYLAIDGEKDDNYMRRLLPHVDFTKLEPGRRMKFLETLLAPKFFPGRYIVSIWIPSIDPSLEFYPTHNFLFSSRGVPDLTTGLNRVAEFAVPSPDNAKSTASRTLPR